MAAGAVESLAENASDSVVAPLFCFALFGLPGAIAYRAINTADAMIGYRGRYEYLGKAAARLDDLANWVPARLTAALLLAAGACAGCRWRRGWRILRRDGGTHREPQRRPADGGDGGPAGRAAGEARPLPRWATPVTPVGTRDHRPRLVAGLRRHVRRRRPDAAVVVGARMKPSRWIAFMADPIPRSWSGWAWARWISTGCWTSA